ncbi:uncharacterized protein LOC143888931 [Tasmannia lanceolata]|uniref:uncharacterized protein LOC143888931 n=1 Tax=Tasmannia lanceolata TaxID=3420 RepID=UPI004062CEB5
MYLCFDYCLLLHPGESGGGGVIRDHNAKIILAFSLYYEIGSNMVAESRALLDGLRCCSAFKVPKIIVESDSKVLIDLILSKGQIPWAIQYLWKEIQNLLAILSPSYQHQYREGNSVADSLANFRCSSKNNLFYSSRANLPRHSRGAARCDAAGLPNIRPSTKKQQQDELEFGWTSHEIQVKLA